MSNIWADIFSIEIHGNMNLKVPSHALRLSDLEFRGVFMTPPPTES